MGTNPSAAAETPEKPGWTPCDGVPAGDLQCDLLHLAHRLPMAPIAARFSSLGHRLFPVLSLAQQRPVGKDPSRLACACARTGGQKTTPDRGQHRQSKCQDYGGWRPAWLRCRKEGNGAE